MENAQSRPKHFSSPSPWICNDISITTATAINLEGLPRDQEDKDHCKSSHVSSGNKLISLFASDAILKLFTVMFFGILPCGFKNHTKKLSYSWLSLILVLLHWYFFVNYVHFAVAYGTSEDQPKNARISMEEAMLSSIDGAAKAVTYTLAMYYFYRNKNNFSKGNNHQGWSVIPKIPLDLAMAVKNKKQAGPSRKDWFLANVFLLIGFCPLAIKESISFKFNSSNNFGRVVGKLSWQRQLQYFPIGLTYLFAAGATIVSCCILFVITRDLIRHIEDTENAILVRARNRDDFYRYHQSLHEYTDKMTSSCKHWFTIHNLFFIALIFAFVFEWFKAIKRGKGESFLKTSVPCQQVLFTSAIVSSLTITFIFAFPFISASQVTSRFSKFYFNLTVKCKIEGIPELTMLSMNSGFKVYGFRINTSIAILTFISSFAGLFKMWYLFK